MKNGGGLAGLKEAFKGLKKTSEDTVAGIVDGQEIIVRKSGNTAKNVKADIATCVASLVVLGASLYSTYEVSKKLADESISTGEKIASLGTSMAAATGSAAMLGYQLGGPWGAAFGAAAGFVGSAAVALVGLMTTAVDTTQVVGEMTSIFEAANSTYNDHQQVLEGLSRSYEELKKSTQSDVEDIKILKDVLSEYVDENGNVTGSVEDVQDALNRLNEILGTNYTVTDGKITNNGELITSYQELETSIDNYTDAYILGSVQRMAAARKANQFDRLVEAKRAQEEAKKAVDDYRKAYEKYIESVDKNGVRNSKQVQEQVAIMNAELDKLTVQYQSTTSAVKEAQSDIYDSTEGIAESILKETGLYNQLSDDAKYAYDICRNAAIESGDETISSADNVIAKIDELKGQTESLKDGTIQNFSEMDAETKKYLLEQASTVENLTPEVIEKYKEMARGSTDEFSEIIKEIPPESRATILKAATETEGMTPQVTKAWSDLAKSSYTEYSNILSKIDPETKKEITRAMYTVGGMVPTTVQQWQELAENDLETYNAYMDQLPEETQQSITDIINKVKAGEPLVYADVRTLAEAWAQLDKDKVNLGGKVNESLSQYVGGIRSKKWEVDSATGEIRQTVKTGLSNIDTSYEANMTVSGFAANLYSYSNRQKLASKVNALGSLVPTGIRKLLGIASPSKVARKLASYVPEGMALGLNDKAYMVAKSMQALTDEITVNTKDTALGQALDINDEFRRDVEIQVTATISGTVQNNMKELIAEAVTNANVNVNIEAKTEEGVIVRKATDGINSYIRQTGEMPFPVLI